MHERQSDSPSLVAWAEGPDRPCLSVAPMMKWTTHHFRQLARMLTQRALLYTEMYPVDLILDAHQHSSSRLHRLLSFDTSQRPLAVQLGGRDPNRMAQAARLCAAFGYDEININVGCPSYSVSTLGGYGACLMSDAPLVQALAAAVRRAVPATIAVTIKHRLGVELSIGDVAVKHALGVDLGMTDAAWESLCEFIRVVSSPPASVRHFVCHARKAILGQSTAANREIPPLQHALVFKLKACFPHLSFELNGQVQTLAHTERILRSSVDVDGRRLHGCMLGRAAYHNPWLLADADRRLFGMPPPMMSRRDVVQRYCAYTEGVWADSKGALEKEEREMMERDGHSLRSAELQRRLRLKQSELREQLYAPLLNLFSGSRYDQAYRRRLQLALERRWDVAKGGPYALHAVPDAEVDELPIPAHESYPDAEAQAAAASQAAAKAAADAMAAVLIAEEEAERERPAQLRRALR